MIEQIIHRHSSHPMMNATRNHHHRVNAARLRCCNRHQSHHFMTQCTTSSSSDAVLLLRWRALELEAMARQSNKLLEDDLRRDDVAQSN